MRMVDAICMFFKFFNYTRLPRKHTRLNIVMVLSILLAPFTSYAFECDIEKDLQSGLERSRSIIISIQKKILSGASLSTEIIKLQSAAENIRTTDLLLEERFKLREEKVKALGTKALGRHQVMVEGYRKALTEYLSLIESLTPSDESQLAIHNPQPATGSSQPVAAKTQQLLDLLNKLLSKKKRPIIGSLPYKHLNYPSQQLTTAASVTPAYLGGNKILSPDDTSTAPEAPISTEIAALAQSLNWNPVSIYEYVKNNIDTEWYWGCMKGAEDTLHQKSGNDCDQATLLAALLRASGFPTRYVRGVIQFFPDIEKAKNLTGIDDPAKIAEFFQKAGIPFKPVIAGGKIANIQIEHVWVESQIPYSNYRGAIIDTMGKAWLGLDTNIKVKGYTYSSAPDILSVMSLSTIRDEYLGLATVAASSTPFELNQTPLEYLKSSVNAALFVSQPTTTYSDYLRSKTIVPEVLNILPGSLQFTLIKATNEYSSIPDELIHRVKFTATDQNNNELFTITLPAYKLSNQQIVISYEPETVQDQEVIDSFGGLGNTPAYLVHLRPVLKVNDERIVVAQGGVSMGGEFNLTIDLISPNGTQSVTNSQIVSNLSVIGISAQRAIITPSPLAGEGGGEGGKDAARLLYEEAMNYNDRWNKAEEELASLFHLAIIRPLPTVVTLGGVIDVTYLLDTPHGFTWKGVFIDASERAIETVASDESRAKTFIQLSSLQGSILENRMFEDDFQVESISTAKLFQLAAGNTQLVTIDKTNIDALLPTLPFDDNIKEDIMNSVNQNYVVRIPDTQPATGFTYHNWTGLGYLKENPDTGESGWMLSGMIAGGSTVDAQWLNNLYLQQTLSTPYAGPVNHDPLAAVRMYKIPATDKQDPKTVGTALVRPFAVAVLDGKDTPVVEATVTFRLIAGGGKIQCLNQAGTPIGQPSESSCDALTSNTGIAKATLILGVKTDANADYMKLDASDENYTQIGLNLVTATAASHSGAIALNAPFEAYGKPDVPAKIQKVYPLKNVYVLVDNPAGSLQTKVTDTHGNPVSNVPLIFKAEAAESNDPAIDPLPAGYRNLELYTRETCTNPYPLSGDCAASDSIPLKTHYYGAQVETILGNTLNTHYRVSVSSPVLSSSATITYDLYSEGGRSSAGAYVPSVLMVWNMGIVNDKGEPVNAAKAGTELKAPLAAKMFLLQDEYDIQSEQCTKQDSSGNTITYTGYTLVSKGTMSIRPVANGTVGFQATQGGGTAAHTQNTGNGLYRAAYRTGATPAKNIIEANGSATVTVPQIYGVNQSGGYVPKTKCLESSNIPTATVTLQHGEYALFDQATNALAQVYDTDMKPTFTAFGVDTQLSVEPSIILLSNLGFTTVDTKLMYTILPPDYNALRTDLDSYKTGQNNTETWDGYVVADKTQGQGQVVFVAGSPFDITQLYKEQVVLNRGTDMEVRGEKKEIPVAQISVKKDQSLIEADEIKFGDGSRPEKKYYLEFLSRALLKDCASLAGKISAVNSNGQTITVPGAQDDSFLSEYSLVFPEAFFGGCKIRIKDMTDNGNLDQYLVVSNKSRAALNWPFGFNPDLIDTTVLYSGIGNTVKIEINGAEKFLPIEPVGVIVLGIDGLRQDVLYDPSTSEASYNDPQGCVTGSCHVDPAQLNGLCDVLGGKISGILSTSCDPAGYENKHVKLPNVTAIFPSITFASWASIFSGKLPNETGILGNEFFARDRIAYDSINQKYSWANLPGLSATIPGLETFPPGMVTLDADGGAFNPGGTSFAITHVSPVEFSLFGIFAGADTLSKKMELSAPNAALIAEPMWAGINSIVGAKYATSADINTRCDKSEYECRTVSMFNQYARSADWWGTPGNFWANAYRAILSKVGLHSEAALLDESSAGETVDFIKGYYARLNPSGKRKRFPSVFSVYLPGIDHYAHAEGMEGYVNFFKNMTDVQVKNIVDALKGQDEFDNKIFIITADHGHTAMPTDLTYTKTVTQVDEFGAEYTIDLPKPAEMSCELKTDFQIDPNNPDAGKNNRRAEQANNNLHIWELGEILKAAAEESGLYYKLLAPAAIAGLLKDKNQNELPYGATSEIAKANVIAALNGPMAHIYLRSGGNWKNIPSEDELNNLAIVFKRMLQESGISLDVDVKNKFARLLSSVDRILIRQNGIYKIFNGYDNTGSLVPPDDISILSDLIYVKPVDRVMRMNNIDRSGDIVLIFKDFTNDVSQNRYTSGVACKSWHGSLSTSDSYVPLIVTYPGGNKTEFEPFVNNTPGCSTSQGCDGNWRVTDLIKSIIKKQYSTN